MYYHYSLIENKITNVLRAHTSRYIFSSLYIYKFSNLSLTQCTRYLSYLLNRKVDTLEYVRGWYDKIEKSLRRKEENNTHQLLDWDRAKEGEVIKIFKKVYKLKREKLSKFLEFLSKRILFTIRKFVRVRQKQLDFQKDGNDSLKFTFIKCCS